jgi:RNA polymerase sigma-54 factor
MLAPSMRTQARQIQTLSPRLQHAVRLLQMSSVEFAAQLRASLGQNPFLEADESEGEAPADLPFATDHDAPGSVQTDAALAEGFGASADSMISSDASDPMASASSDDADDSIDRSDDRDLWQADGASRLLRADDGDGSVMDTVAAETMLNEHLHAQLNLLPLSPRDLMLARAIVESLDDDGYLRTPLSELLTVVPVEPEPALDELQIALRHVQALEPAGVGARDVAECLRLQLDAIECPQTRKLAGTIVDEHLGALAARDVAGLARALSVSAERVEMVCDRIRRLDPRPGWRVGTSAARYIVPDVIVKKQHGVWTVQLNPAVVPKVRLNHMYAELFQRHCKERNPEMSQHLQEARWTMRNVEQRFSTILSVAEAIVRRQRYFLEFGAMAMKPLGLREIADEVGVHESTVSRVTNNKYMTTPNGVYELKYFFSRAMVSDSGSACSGTAIRGLIKDMIAVERPDAPLSDAEITRQLSQQGLKVARRTVTKYRQMLKVEAVDRRRRVAS